jgi:hypothetical protein
VGVRSLAFVGMSAAERQLARELGVGTEPCDALLLLLSSAQRAHAVGLRDPGARRVFLMAEGEGGEGGGGGGGGAAAAASAERERMMRLYPDRGGVGGGYGGGGGHPAALPPPPPPPELSAAAVPAAQPGARELELERQLAELRAQMAQAQQR